MRVSDASVAVRAAPSPRRRVGGVVQLGGGEAVGGVGGGGGESAGFAGQSQLPQGVQGVHLSSTQQVALTLKHRDVTQL